eukprot:364446-Chlamydomonas_euryale.AAC.5
MQPPAAGVSGDGHANATQAEIQRAGLAHSASNHRPWTAQGSTCVTQPSKPSKTRRDGVSCEPSRTQAIGRSASDTQAAPGRHACARVLLVYCCSQPPSSWRVPVLAPPSPHPYSAHPYTIDNPVEPSNPPPPHPPFDNTLSPALPAPCQPSPFDARAEHRSYYAGDSAGYEDYYDEEYGEYYEECFFDANGKPVLLNTTASCDTKVWTTQGHITKPWTQRAWVAQKCGRSGDRRDSVHQQQQQPRLVPTHDTYPWHLPLALFTLGARP